VGHCFSSFGCSIRHCEKCGDFDSIFFVPIQAFIRKQEMMDFKKSFKFLKIFTKLSVGARSLIKKILHRASQVIHRMSFHVYISRMTLLRNGMKDLFR